jgi:hypothetical protein
MHRDTSLLSFCYFIYIESLRNVEHTAALKLRNSSSIFMHALPSKSSGEEGGWEEMIQKFSIQVILLRLKACLYFLDFNLAISIKREEETAYT